MPGNPAAALEPGLEAVSRAVTGAAASKQETDYQVATINRQRQVQLQTGDVAANLATAQGALSIDLLKLREQSEPGAAGYEDAANQRIEQFRTAAHDMLGPDPEVQARFIDNIASIAANARTGETEWAMKQRAEKSATDGDQLQSAVQSNIRTAVAGGSFIDSMLGDADKLDATYVNAQPIPGNLKQKWLTERHDARLITRIDAGIDVDPHAMLAAIDAGKYGELDDKLIEPLRNKARVAADRLDTRLNQAATEQAGVERAHAQNAIEDVGAGVTVDPTLLSGYRTTFAASQKPEDIRLVHDLDTALARNMTTAKYDDATQDQRRGAIGEIETHQGWEKDQQLVAAHTQLQTLINRDDQAADKDPLSLYQRQTGQQIGKLDLHDPSAMNQRFIASDRAAARYGKPLPMVFTAPEADQVKAQYNQATAAGKADFILSLGAYGSTRARQMMFQIAPTKPELVRLAELSAAPDPAVKAIVREAADGSAVPTKEGVAAGVRSSAQREFGAAMARMPGDRQAAILQVASWVYAHRAAAAGKANVFDPALAHDAINAALGGTASKGGIGNRNGAAVVLPMGATQDDFDRMLAMGAGHPEAVRQAANGVPKWLNGQDMTTGQFLDLVPVQITDSGSQTLYAFKSRGGSGYVKTERGDDYVLDMRRLSAAIGHRRFNAELAAHGYVRK